MTLTLEWVQAQIDILSPAQHVKAVREHLALLQAMRAVLDEECDREGCYACTNTNMLIFAAKIAFATAMDSEETTT